jgi:hypothetical protein
LAFRPIVDLDSQGGQDAARFGDDIGPQLVAV